MARRVAALALAAALAPRPAEAAPPMRASIEVDADALGDEAEEVARTVADAGDVVLRDADVLPARDDDDGTIHVELAPGYRFTAWGERDGSEVAGTRSEGDCSGCSSEDLAQAVAKAVGAMVEPMREATPPAIAEEEPTPTPTPTPPPDDRGRVKIGAFGVGGIVLMGVGLGAIGGGAALLARGRDVAPDPDDPSRLEGTDFRPGGGALFAVGVAAVITGAVMLFVGVKKGKEARQRKTALLPRVDPHAGGFTVRF